MTGAPCSSAGDGLRDLDCGERWTATLGGDGNAPRALCRRPADEDGDGLGVWSSLPPKAGDAILDGDGLGVWSSLPPKAGDAILTRFLAGDDLAGDALLPRPLARDRSPVERRRCSSKSRRNRPCDLLRCLRFLVRQASDTLL